MAKQYLYAAFTNLVTDLPVLIALAAGIAFSAINLQKRPKSAMAGIIGFSGFLFLELAMPFANYALIGVMVRAESMSIVSMIQAIIRILSSVAAAALWAAFIYALYFADKKTDSRQAPDPNR